jgi:CelD/BcsL family acetyltransferase involved in cellulose biosynthesis
MNAHSSIVSAVYPPPLGECVVETITDRDAFIQLETEWNDAVDRAGIAHPFLSHEWLRTWWDAFGGDRRLHILVVRCDRRIVAIAPLMLEKGRMYGMPIRRLSLLQNDHSPRADFILVERPADAYEAIWRALFRERHNWDVLQVSQLPAESPTLGILSQLADADGCPSGIWRSGASPYITLTGTESDYRRSLSPKFRQNIRNRIARLRQIGEPALEVVTGVGIRSAFGDVVRLEESGWQHGAGTAIGADDTSRRFYADLTERMAARRSPRLMFLTVNGRRIAAAYSLCDGRRWFLCKTGYDPEFETVSPFKVLMHFLIRQAYVEGLVEVDLLGDPEPWKLEWTKTTRSHNWLFIFSETHRARLLYPVKFRLIPSVKRAVVTGFVSA